MEDPYLVENIKKLFVFMFQTWDNSQLLRRVLWISAELTIGATFKHKCTQPLYMFNRVRVLHLNRLKERTWLHSFDLIWVASRRKIKRTRKVQFITESLVFKPQTVRWLKRGLSSFQVRQHFNFSWFYLTLFNSSGGSRYTKIQLSHCNLCTKVSSNQ